ncbi:PepSY-like domain-containing protein [Flavobacterium sp.]|uniref:PepSY-like domain-containing protein n=1 Tax=Flavobacterium sp. TaxID=239 RepID=UPI0040480B5F
MKKSMILMSLFMMTFVSFAQKIKEQNVPQVVKNALIQKFPKATKLKWDKEGENFEASFDLDDVDNSVLFNKAGRIIETEVEITTTQLPETVLNYLRTNYKDQKIKEAAKITSENGKVTYETEIKGKDLLFDENGKLLSVS